MAAGSGKEQLAVPPGFRFHPTDEELLYYYLRKKVSFQPIDLDVIRDVDLNKLEPWDLKEKCRIGSSTQNEWYFFSHKDKKYPTGTRTNRATTEGFWKATGRDKPIYLTTTNTTTAGTAVYSNNCSERIGMRKTLVFYIGRAPHGQKTDWIMHEYRLEDINVEIQDEGWVVCRVFRKKNHSRGSTLQPDISTEDEEHHRHQQKQPQFMKHSSVSPPMLKEANYRQKLALKGPYDDHSTFDASMHLPQLLSQESLVATSTSLFPPTAPIISNAGNNVADMSECSHHHSLLMRWITSPSTSGGGYGSIHHPPQAAVAPGDYSWPVLDKLLASHSNQLGHHDRDHHQQQKRSSSSLSQSKYGPPQIMDVGLGGTSLSTQKFSHQYVGCETDNALNFSQ